MSSLINKEVFFFESACLFIFQNAKGDRYSLSILEQEWDSLQVKLLHGAANLNLLTTGPVILLAVCHRKCPTTV